MVVIIVVVLTILFALIRARRGLLLMVLLTIVLAYLLYLSNSNSKSFLIFISVVLVGFLVVYGLDFFNENEVGIFNHISEKGLEDTRSNVELSFYKDMDPWDWLVGKGMDGTYFCPGIDDGNMTGYRSTIETDYLQTILKGGIVSLGLFLLIALPAMFKGIFYSKNILSKAAGLWILWALINMYPSSINTFTMQYILVWIAIGICYSKILRNMPEEILTEYFRNRKEFANEYNESKKQ
jgi:hypothetical protein